jgi:hypothetical protein
MSVRFALVSAAVCACLVLAPSARADDPLWQELSSAQLSAASEHAAYRQLGLDGATLNRLRDDLRDGGTLALPLAQGGFSAFALEDSGTMHPELAAKFPELLSLRGRDAENRRVRVDISPRGLRAMIFADEGVSVIEPESAGSERYFNFDRRDYAGANVPFVCGVHREEAASTGVEPKHHGAAPKTQTGQVLRTYRLAVAATGEYTTAVSAPNPASVAGGLAAIVTSINRVNEVYETDIATRLVLIPTNNLVVYTNGGTDPYSNGNGSTMLGQNQTNLDAVIGSANYDVGHVFSTGGGGVASLNVPCTSSKARGVTGQPNPVGDPFDIDYVAHEVGHQFNAPHTFNGSTGSCGGGNRSGTSAYEPGSGSTIMAYAGICGAENLQPNSDPYFHAASIASIVTGFSNDACDVEIAQTNAAPVIAPIAAHTLPANTPFVLTASATDADGDTLTYGWEQFTLGAASPPNNDAASDRPILRSFNPTLDPSRTFPRLATLLGAPATFGESLPTRNWPGTFRFRVTVRDQVLGAGATQSADVALTVTGSAGPFALTGPAAGADWTCGQTRTATWNVANTTAAPVSCATVRLELSDDGGVNFDHVLAASTANDGSADVVVPFALTNDARLRASCNGNIFFAISTADFDVVDAGPSLANDDSAPSIPEDGSTLTIPFAALTGNDVSPGTVIGVSNAVGGSVSLAVNAVEFTPAPDFNGDASFDYVLLDGCERPSGRETQAEVVVPVLPVNDAPVLASLVDVLPPAGATGPQQVSGFASVASFGAPDESTQQIDAFPTSILLDPQGVLTSVSIDAAGELTYVLSGAAGVAQVEVRARDNGGTANAGVDTSAPLTFTITARAAPDVAASISNGTDVLVEGGVANYLARFTNQGIGATEGVRLRVAAPSGLLLGGWSCSASGGAVCPAPNGGGAIDVIADLAPGQALEFSLIAIVTAQAGDSVTVTADLLSDAQFIDIAGNDLATDNDLVAPIDVFSDGFEVPVAP